MNELLIHAVAWNSNADIMLNEKKPRVIKGVALYDSIYMRF